MAAKTAADKAVFILGRSVSCCAANVLNRLQGKAVLLGVGDMTQMITSKEKWSCTTDPLKPWWQLHFFLCHTPTWLTWRRSAVTSATAHLPPLFLSSISCLQGFRVGTTARFICRDCNTIGSVFYIHAVN